LWCNKQPTTKGVKQGKQIGMKYDKMDEKSNKGMCCG
jgi:hypothetical protein